MNRIVSSAPTHQPTTAVPDDGDPAGIETGIDPSMDVEPALTIETIETPSLGDRSYLVHDGRSAMIVDPQRDIDRVLKVLDLYHLQLAAVFETHVHNDYVSGGLPLARRTGARLHLPAGSDVSYDHVSISDGDVVDIGSFQVRAIATPGHTPDHQSFVVSSRGDTVAAFTGGCLLYGTVGRTDLIGPDATEALTREQWSSARRLVSALPAEVTVHPTHGFGSFCASKEGSDRSEGTIGDEASENIACRIDDVDAFVDHLTSGMSDTPAYYAHMGLLNRGGMGEPDLSMPTLLDPVELRHRLEAGEWVLDLRDRRAYADRHLVGSVSFDSDGPFVVWAGWLIPWGSRLTLISDDPNRIARAQRDLARIGMGRPSGAATGTVDRALADGHDTATYPVANFDVVADRLHSGHIDMMVVDVRRTEEWDEGHISEATHLPLQELLARAPSFTQDHAFSQEQAFDQGNAFDDSGNDDDGGIEPALWVHCASGARAAIAASLLARSGKRVVLIDDDFERAEALGIPMTR